MHATSLRSDVPDRQPTLNEHFLCFLVSYNIILLYYIKCSEGYSVEMAVREKVQRSEP